MRCRHHVVLEYTPYLLVVLVATYCQGTSTATSRATSTVTSTATSTVTSTATSTVTSTATSTSSTISTPEIVPESPKNLTSTTLNSSAIELRWDPVSEADKYIIQWQAHNDETDDGNETTNENVTVFTIGGLKPWTNYNFTVIASRNKFESEPAITTNRTHPDAPCQPENMTINQTNSFNNQPILRIEWSEPICTNGPLNGYEVVWNKTGSDENQTISTNATFYDVDNLEPWTEYKFFVFAYNEAEDNSRLRSKGLSEIKKTDPSNPCRPGNITINQTNPYSNQPVLVQWTKPSCSNGPLDGYEICWKKQNSSQSSNETTRNTSFTVRDLEPWTDYVFSVLAFNNASDTGRLRSEKQNTTIETSASEPCPPGNITIHQSNRYSNQPVLVVEWVKPNCSNGPLDGYEIYWKKQYSDQKINQTTTINTSVTVKNLEPWTDYVFSVLAFNSASDTRSEERNSTVKTDPSKPCPPGIITFNQSNPYSNQPVLVVQWMEPNCTNGPLDGYEIYWMMQYSNQSMNKTITRNTSITVGNLKPWTDYVFFVLAFNNAPDRLDSEEGNATIKTYPSHPKSPTNLTLTCNETTLHAEWSPPYTTNGNITGYNISWKKEQCELDESDEWMTTYETKYFVDNLDPATNYSFSVFAFIEFEGEVLNGTVDCKQCRTSDDYPLLPSNVSCEVNSSAISISWQEPTLKRGEILNYTVSYSKSNSSDILITTPYKRLVINELEAYTKYEIRVSAWTPKGQGNWSTPVTCRTASAVPNAPSGVLATNIDSKSISVKWNPSVPYPGIITYRVITEKLHCGTKTLISNKTNEAHTKTKITDLDPYTEYIISVSAATDAGSSNPTSSDPIRTSAAAPGKVTKLELDCSVKSNVISLSWQSPDTPNGAITSYLIKYTGVKVGKKTHTDEKTVFTNGSNSCKPEKLNTIIDNLVPEYKYSISVSAKVANVQSYGPPVTKECTLSAGIPPPPGKNISVIKSSKEEIVFQLDNDTFSDKKGDIIEYAIIIAEAENIGFPTAKERNSVKLPTWSDFQKNGSVLQYQATPEGWNPFNDSAENDPLECKPGKIKNVQVCTLGCQVKCDENDYCNGPLAPGMHYGFKLRGYTKKGFSETWPAKTNTKSEPKSSIGNIITAVAVAITVFVVIIAGGFLFHKYGTVRTHQLILRLSPRRFLKSTVMPRAQAPPSDIFSFTPSVTHTRPVKLSDFSNHVSYMMSDSALKFSQEFDELKSVSPSHPCSAAMLPDNRPKNRWINILPFDHSRVKLLPVDDEPASDYINGSYIPGFTCHREYIATQGPLPGTVDDMWRMIWEQGVNMIVMLTQCVERGKTKCEQYWPAEAQNATYGDLKVQTMSESVLSDYTIRTFDLSLGSRHRVITHLHFTKWPDFGCPENTELLINFVRAVRDHISEGDPSPLLVHCSAGVGRTGTFIAVDRLMQHIVLHDYADIFQNVLDMREHRTNMVQTEDQYIYIHECVRDLVQEKLARNRDSFKNDFYENVVSHTTTNM